ncbi:hypothetical protein D3C78_622980 [compost metagenome]
MDHRHLGLQGLRPHGAGETVVDHHRRAVAVADFTGDAGVAEHGAEAGAVLVDVVEVAHAVMAQVGLEIQRRVLVVVARVVEAELGVVQRLGGVAQGHAVLAAVTGFVVLEAGDEA